MSRTPNKIIQSLAPVLVVGAIVVPSAGASERTATELGQSTASPSATPNSESSERTATELGQAVGEPADQEGAAANAQYSRTPTETGQRVATSVAPDATSTATDAKPSGFDWGDAAVGATAMLGLMGFGGALAVVLVNRRRHAIRDSRVPAVSS